MLQGGGMNRLEKILCPTDFSNGSLQALSAATDIATKFEAELYLIHVLPILPTLAAEPTFNFEVHHYQYLLQEDAKKRLDAIILDLKGKSVRARAYVGLGDAANEIVRVAQEQRIDLIVIATYGKTGWRRLAFGSVTEKVVRLAPCPVLTVRGVEERTAAEKDAA
jgi:nucleotide-binding universal stress UspA family protein